MYPAATSGLQDHRAELLLRLNLLRHFKRFATQLEACLDALFSEPALVHLQHVAYRFGRAMRIGGLGLHVNQIDDRAIVCDKGSGEWQERIFHPEALHRCLFKDKDHAFLLWHVFAKHQANATLLGCHCYLGVDAKHPGFQRDTGQIGLGGILAPGWQSGKQQGAAHQRGAAQ